MREPEIYPARVGNREFTMKNHNGAPARKPPPHPTAFSPGALIGNKRRVGRKISAPLEGILFCERCGITEIRRREA